MLAGLIGLTSARGSGSEFGYRVLPAAGMADRLVPRDVAPPVQLLLGVTERLRQLHRKPLDVVVDDRVELRLRHRAVDEAPLLGLRGRDLVAEQQDLARTAVADEDR